MVLGTGELDFAPPVFILTAGSPDSLLWGLPLLQGPGIPPAASNEEQTAEERAEAQQPVLSNEVFFSI